MRIKTQYVPALGLIVTTGGVWQHNIPLITLGGVAVVAGVAAWIKGIGV